MLISLCFNTKAAISRARICSVTTRSAIPIPMKARMVMSSSTWSSVLRIVIIGVMIGGANSIAVIRKFDMYHFIPQALVQPHRISLSGSVSPTASLRPTTLELSYLSQHRAIYPRRELINDFPPYRRLTLTLSGFAKNPQIIRPR